VGTQRSAARSVGCGAGEAASRRVAELAASPGRASGDLRQIRRLLGGSAEGPHATAAYAYASDVLSLRWPQVQALAGALLVLGTVDGSQAAELLSKQRACGAAGEVEAREAALAGESGPLVWVRGWPLLFGCVWAASLPAETRGRVAAGGDAPAEPQTPEGGRAAKKGAARSATSASSITARGGLSRLSRVAYMYVRDPHDIKHGVWTLSLALAEQCR